MGNDTSTWRSQRDGLPQGSALAPVLFNLYSNDVAENSLKLATYVSPFKTNSSANWDAVSRQIWRGCHTSVDSDDLNQAPPKQSAVCSRPLRYAVLQRTLDEDCRQAEEPKQLADEASRFHRGRQCQFCGHLLWRFAIQEQSTAPQSGHALLTKVRSMCS